MGAQRGEPIAPHDPQLPIPNRVVPAFAAPDAAWGETACAAVNRYLHTPMKRHHGLRLAAQALDFVAGEG